LCTFARDEAEIFKCIGKEGAKVFLAARDAGARRQLPLPEPAGPDASLKRANHARPFRYTPWLPTSSAGRKSWNSCDEAVIAWLGLSALRIKLSCDQCSAQHRSRYVHAGGSSVVR